MYDMLNMVKKYDGQPVTEVHIVGGVLPQYDVAFYSALFTKIRLHRQEKQSRSASP